ncbi:unnamed protein product, partial [Durusdinium trenchii]
DSAARASMKKQLDNLRMLNLGICARMGVLMIYAAKKIAEGHDDAYSDVLFRACLYVADLDSDFPNRTMNGSTNGRFAWDVGPLCLCFYLALLGKMWACFDMAHYQINQAYVVGKTCLMAALFVDMW